jgi:hypothetical protein
MVPSLTPGSILGGGHHPDQAALAITAGGPLRNLTKTHNGQIAYGESDQAIYVYTSQQRQCH